MKQFEYKVIKIEPYDGYEARYYQTGLNEQGKEGWELVTVVKNCFIMKRPKE